MAEFLPTSYFPGYARSTGTSLVVTNDFGFSFFVFLFFLNFLIKKSN